MYMFKHFKMNCAKPQKEFLAFEMGTGHGKSLIISFLAQMILTDSPYIWVPNPSGRGVTKKEVKLYIVSRSNTINKRISAILKSAYEVWKGNLI